MTPTEAELALLRKRVARNCELWRYGANPLQRAVLRNEASLPLVGMALVAGLWCGGGGGLSVLSQPLIRNALQALLLGNVLEGSGDEIE